MRFRTSLLLLALVISSGHAFAAPDDALVAREKRKGAPKLSLPGLDGQKGQLSRLKGKIVVVNFWATWCGPCKAEMPEFTRVHAEYRDRGVEFVGAANEARSEKGKIEEFVGRLDIRFPIWMEADLAHLQAFGVGPGIPATVVVDPQGKIAARIKGPTDAAQLRALLDRLLLEANASTASAGLR